MRSASLKSQPKKRYRLKRTLKFVNKITSVGLEIEVNHLTAGLRESVNKNLWTIASEHCGRELRSVPCRGPTEIRRLIRSIEEMQKWSSYAGFDNAGTHIHIDFLRDCKTDVSVSSLRRKSANKVGDIYVNPTGSGKKYYWISPDGACWSSPKAFTSYSMAGFESPAQASRSRKLNKASISVKRFLALGIRFADCLTALQHPDRRFNKYCHSLADWDEELLFSVKSISEICNHQNLLQGHRRHAFNPLAFEKYGTVEIRMLKASLNPMEIWAQIFLFTRMAELAKSEDGLPSPIGRVTVDFCLLLDACDIHGRIRRQLLTMFNRNMCEKNFNIRCFRCEKFRHQSGFTDIGLSRGLCEYCSIYNFCVACKNAMIKTDKDACQLDHNRFLCSYCSVRKNDYRDIEKSRKSMLSYGDKVGSGFDELGFKALRRMRAIFT